MSWHCTVLRARELFVLHMRTLAIQYPDPWGKSAIPNKENSPPCPGWGEVGANIDRCIIQKCQRQSLFSDTDSEGDVSIIPSTPKVHTQGGKSHLPSGKNLLNEFVAAKARYP